MSVFARRLLTLLPGVCAAVACGLSIQFVSEMCYFARISMDVDPVLLPTVPRRVVSTWSKVDALLLGMAVALPLVIALCACASRTVREQYALTLMSIVLTFWSIALVGASGAAALLLSGS